MAVDGLAASQSRRVRGPWGLPPPPVMALMTGLAASQSRPRDRRTAAVPPAAGAAVDVSAAAGASADASPAPPANIGNAVPTASPPLRSDFAIMPTGGPPGSTKVRLKLSCGLGVGSR